MNQGNWIEFDIASIVALKLDYEKTCEFIKDELPDVNWNSYTEMSDYFSTEHNIYFYSMKISHLKEMLDNIEEEEYIRDIDECKEVLQGIIELKKLQSTLRNYLNNILKHNEGGIVYLREVDGRICMPNKQNLPYSPDILECVIATPPNIKL